MNDESHKEVVLAKAVRRTAVWLGLDKEALCAATGLDPSALTVRAEDEATWSACLVLVCLAGRLERLLGQRRMVLQWMRSPHTVLQPNPGAVLTTHGPQKISDYLDTFER